MFTRRAIQPIWWIIHKDLKRAIRAHSIWPTMLLLGLLLVSLIAMQIDLPDEQKQSVVSGLLWLAVAFAGTLAVEWSFVSEREDGCWQTLTLYPVAPSLLYMAKVSTNVVSLIVLEIVLVPLFVVMTDVSLLAHPAAMVAIALLGNVGFAATGTLVSAVSASLQSRGGLVALLFLPLVAPVLLGCARATALMLAGEIEAQWWRWFQFLGVFAVLFTMTGALIFEYQMEE
jgi:heme exporter protein B